MDNSIILKIPYQNDINKQKFDYALSFCNQLNNVNFARNTESEKAKQDNQIYVFFYNFKMYLFVSLGKKENEIEFSPLLDTWIEIGNVEYDIKDKNLSTLLEKSVYYFNIKQFYSVLSFSSNYKDRDMLNFILTKDNIKYRMSDNIFIDLAVSDNENYNDILMSFKKIFNNLHNIEVSTILEATNVDKNSFLLPYFNHKDCLNFTVSSLRNKTYIHKVDDKAYITNINYNENTDAIDYFSATLLRNDKFDYKYDDTIRVSPGLWQLLVILQNNKLWKKLVVTSKFAIITFKDDNNIYHSFDSEISFEDYDKYLDLIKTERFHFVGKLHSEEIFLLNKLYPDSKGSYFDFSTQQFIGTKCVFENGIQTNNKIDLKYPVDNSMPLNLSFTELKHYIGGDLSQKNFILHIYSDGINVLIKKFDTDNEKVSTTQVMFNHNLSKNYLGL